MVPPPSKNSRTSSLVGMSADRSRAVVQDYWLGLHAGVPHEYSPLLSPWSCRRPFWVFVSVVNVCLYLLFTLNQIIIRRWRLLVVIEWVDCVRWLVLSAVYICVKAFGTIAALRCGAPVGIQAWRYFPGSDETPHRPHRQRICCRKSPN